MYDRLTPASTTNQCIVDRRRPTHPGYICQKFGHFIYAYLVMRRHVQRTVSKCFAVLRQLRQIRNSVSTATFQTLVAALVMSRLDYGNSVLIGLPTHLIRHLQSVQNAAARLICKLRRFDHITYALVSLHWRRISERIVYKIAVLTETLNDACQNRSEF